LRHGTARGLDSDHRDPTATGADRGVSWLSGDAGGLLGICGLAGGGDPGGDDRGPDAADWPVPGVMDRGGGRERVDRGPGDGGAGAERDVTADARADL